MWSCRANSPKRFVPFVPLCYPLIYRHNISHDKSQPTITRGKAVLDINSESRLAVPSVLIHVILPIRYNVTVRFGSTETGPKVVEFDAIFASESCVQIKQALQLS